MSNDTFRREMLSPVGSMTETSGPVAMVLGGRYELKREIGKGGMGKVHRAHDRTLGRTVAVKVITSVFADTKEFRARFVREAKLHSQIEHPNVVRVYDCGDDGDRLYLVMELIEGRRLDHVVTERQGFKVEEAIRIMADILLGLHAIHAKGSVHRDMKGANVMLVGPNLEAKILDFGLVKQIASPDDIAVDSTQLTQVNGVLGSPNYMSPEQCRGEEVDHRSDVYAAGIMLYEMIAGRLPFSIPGMRHDPASIISRQLHAAPPRFYETLAGTLVPPDVEGVVRKALEKKPDDRFSSALEMRDALLSARMREEDYRKPPPKKRGWLMPVAAAVLACVALAAAGIFWGGGSGKDATVVEVPVATQTPIPAAVPPEHRPPAPGSAASSMPEPSVPAAAPRVEKTPAPPPPIAKAPPPRPAAAATTDQGCALFDSYESAKAVEVLTTVVRSSPNDRRAWYCLCGSYSRIPDVQPDEVATCEKANALNRNNRGERVLTARWLEQARKGK